MGIPLTLAVTGSSLYGKGVEIWESLMDKYEHSMDKTSFGLLHVSFESLDYDEKEIFLDVSCFFKGHSVDYVEEILEGRGFSSKNGLRVLEDRCLVERQFGFLWMHDLVESMGREIVRLESEREPGKRSRIWFHRDALQVLTRDTGTSKVEGLVLEFRQLEEVQWSGNAFEKMVNLRILIIRNAVFSKAPKELPNSLRVLEWDNYPSSSLPSNFHGNELLKFSLTNPPRMMQLQETFETYQNITNLFIQNCEGLTEVPDFSAVPNLTNLILGCRNLVKIPDSVAFLSKLKVLSTRDCSELKEFPALDQSKSLEVLDITGCRRLKYFPIAPRNLQTFMFYETDINVLRESGCRLIQELMDRRYSGLYCMSGARVPSCFRYRSNTNSTSFWIRKSFPDFHVSFAAVAIGPMHSVHFIIRLRIRLKEIQVEASIMAHRQRASTKIRWINPLLSNDEGYPELRELLRSGNWLRVDLRVDPVPYTPIASTSRHQTSDAFVTECGVYASPTCDVDFSFVDPYRQYPTAGEHDPPSSSDSDLLWRKIKCLNVPPQVKNFVRTTAHRDLPSSAPLHVIKEWEWARAVWLASPLGLRVDRMEADNWREWMFDMASILDYGSLELFVVIAWGLWSERNKLYMGLKTEDPPILISRMWLLLDDYKTTPAKSNTSFFSSSSFLLWNIRIKRLNVPPLVHHFAWQAIHDYLPSYTSLHVLKEWQYARAAWMHSPLGPRASRVKGTNFCEWMQKLVRIMNAKGLELFLVIAWGIWSEWEKLCMDLKIEDPKSLINRMCVLLEDHRNIDNRLTYQHEQTSEEDGTNSSAQPACIKLEKGKQICKGRSKVGLASQTETSVRAAIDKIVEMLLEKETLSGDEFTDIFVNRVDRTSTREMIARQRAAR